MEGFDVPYKVKWGAKQIRHLANGEKSNIANRGEVAGSKLKLRFLIAHIEHHLKALRRSN